jgi:hypothetical protein
VSSLRDILDGYMPISNYMADDVQLLKDETNSEWHETASIADRPGRASATLSGRHSPHHCAPTFL